MVELGLATTLTILMASRSWYLLEQPINNLERHFGYLPRGAQEQGAQTEGKSAEVKALGAK